MLSEMSMPTTRPATFFPYVLALVTVAAAYAEDAFALYIAYHLVQSWLVHIGEMDLSSAQRNICLQTPCSYIPSLKAAPYKHIII